MLTVDQEDSRKEGSLGFRCLPTCYSINSLVHGIVSSLTVHFQTWKVLQIMVRGRC